ncbi:hypothetical protein [Azospirillum sp. B4]|uniref:hypothetical protein n=1 Tax=Azospirillum sp. B4 TaxID=95605 RepID=UPI0003465B4A|nr:hypothetical protein [Azospirillum sp. B4]
MSAATPPPQGHNRGAHYARSRCAECGEDYQPTRIDAAFCSAYCRKAHNDRRKERGLALIDAALEWRGKRQKGGFLKFCRLVDQFLRDDRERKAAQKAAREARKKGQTDA